MMLITDGVFIIMRQAEKSLCLTRNPGNQMMARHKANYINVAYAPDAESADKGLATKAAMMHAMGNQVHLSRKVKLL